METNEFWEVNLEPASCLTGPQPALLWPHHAGMPQALCLCHSLSPERLAVASLRDKCRCSIHVSSCPLSFQSSSVLSSETSLKVLRHIPQAFEITCHVVPGRYLTAASVVTPMLVCHLLEDRGSLPPQPQGLAASLAHRRARIHE